jgi:hypothetical protein
MASHKSVRCLLDITEYPWTDYVLPTDTWKVEAVAKDRQQLAIRMAKRADPDGTNITAGHKRWMRELVMPHRTLFRRLDDLKEMHLLPDKEGLTREHGTADRRLDIPAWRAYLEGGVSAPWPRDQECHIRCIRGRAGVPHSGPGVPRTVAPNRNRLTQSTEEEQKQKQEQQQDLGSSENGQKPADGDNGSSFSSKLNDESKTVRQHFGTPWHTPTGEDTVVLITSCIGFDHICPDLVTATTQWQEFEGSDDLLNECRTVIEGLADQPYVENETEAYVMDAAMKRFTLTHGRVPPCWLKKIHDLRRAAGIEEGNKRWQSDYSVR